MEAEAVGASVAEWDCAEGPTTQSGLSRPTLPRGLTEASEEGEGRVQGCSAERAGHPAVL